MTETLEQMLARLSVDELRDYLKELLRTNPQLRSDFLAEFANDTSTKLEVALNQKRIAVMDAFITADSNDYYGSYYLSWEQVEEALTTISATVIEDLNSYITPGDNPQVLDFLLWLANSVTDEEVEDEASWDDFFADELTPLLEAILQAQPSDVESARIYQKIQTYIEADNRGRGYLAAFLRSFVENNFKSEELLLERLDEVNRAIDSGNGQDYELIVKKLGLLHDLGRVEDYQELYDEYKPLRKVRQQEMRFLEEDGKRDDLIALLEESIQRDKTKPWEVERYRKQLVPLYRANGDSEAERQQLRQLALDNPKLETYLAYKAVVPDDEWPGISEELLSLYGDRGVDLLDFYQEEGMLEDMMAYFEHRPSNYWGNLQRFAKDLLPQYSKRYLNVWADMVRKDAAQAKSRSQYQTVAKEISILDSFPGGQVVKHQLIQELEDTYPRRKAFLDELRKVK